MAKEFISFLEKRRRQRRKKRVVKILGIFILVICSILFIENFLQNSTAFLQNKSAILGELVRPNVKSSQPSVRPSIKISKSLEEAVLSGLEGSEAKYSIYIKNLKTGEVYFKDEHEVFEAGSLYKLWVMAEAFKQIEEGVLKEDQVLSQDIVTLNRKFSIDEELAEQTEGGITLTVAQALNQMITISHNYASLLLTEKLRLSSVAAFLKENKFSESKVGVEGSSPTTSSYDVALFLEKLYKGEIVSPESSQKMIELLKKQNLNNKLPKYLPTGSIVAHKTGEIGWFSHDGGIVFNDNGDYIIVILSESSLPAGAEERIAEISKSVYHYFSK